MTAPAFASPAPRFSVIVPTLGNAANLERLRAALAPQIAKRQVDEWIVVFDGVTPAPALEAALSASGARIVTLAARGGPGAARNAGARVAGRDWLAFTEDDVTPADDWLARAAARLEAEIGVDVLEGRTVRPGGRALRMRLDDAAQYLPTNLFVRRSVFEWVGGYCEDLFDARRGVYFREDADLGFSLEEDGARIARDPTVIVTHPDEHPSARDALRWARRYEMDPLLAARHPQLFRERIEVHRVGPLKIRRPIVRCSVASVACAALALIALAIGRPGASLALAAAMVGFALPLALKWRTRWWSLPVALVAPWILVSALLEGRGRAARARLAAPRSAAKRAR